MVYSYSYSFILKASLSLTFKYAVNFAPVLAEMAFTRWS